MSTDPRVEAAAAALRDPKPNQIRYGEDLEEWVDRVMPVALAAADAADREAGIHRVRVDDATVERVAAALHADTGSAFQWEWIVRHRDSAEPFRRTARAVLAALTEPGAGE